VELLIFSKSDVDKDKKISYKKAFSIQLGHPEKQGQRMQQLNII